MLNTESCWPFAAWGKQTPALLHGRAVATFVGQTPGEHRAILPQGCEGCGGCLPGARDLRGQAGIEALWVGSQKGRRMFGTRQSWRSPHVQNPQKVTRLPVLDALDGCELVLRATQKLHSGGKMQQVISLCLCDSAQCLFDAAIDWGEVINIECKTQRIQTKVARSKPNGFQAHGTDGSVDVLDLAAVPTILPMAPADHRAVGLQRRKGRVGGENLLDVQELVLRLPFPNPNLHFGRGLPRFSQSQRFLGTRKNRRTPPPQTLRFEHGISLPRSSHFAAGKTLWFQVQPGPARPDCRPRTGCGPRSPRSHHRARRP